VHIWDLATLEKPEPEDVADGTPAAASAPTQASLSVQRNDQLGGKIIAHVAVSYVAYHSSNSPVLAALLAAGPESPGRIAIGAHAAALQALIVEKFDAAKVTKSLQQLLDLSRNNAAVVASCVQLNRLLSPDEPLQPAGQPTGTTWLAMGPHTTVTHHLIFDVLVRLIVFLKKAAPAARKKASKVVKAHEDAVAAAAEYGEVVRVAQPLVYELNEAALARVAGWAVLKAKGSGQRDSTLRRIAECIIDPSGIRRAEQESYALLADDSDSHSHIGERDHTAALPCVLSFFRELQLLLKSVATTSSLLSLHSSAFLSWQGLLKSSQPLYKAWQNIFLQLPLPPDLQHQLYPTGVSPPPPSSAAEWEAQLPLQETLRHPQDLFVQRYMNAIVMEILA
jgi:hypothetical protein